MSSNESAASNSRLPISGFAYFIEAKQGTKTLARSQCWMTGSAAEHSLSEPEQAFIKAFNDAVEEERGKNAYSRSGNTTIAQAIKRDSKIANKVAKTHRDISFSYASTDQKTEALGGYNLEILSGLPWGTQLTRDVEFHLTHGKEPSDVRVIRNVDVSGGGSSTSASWAETLSGFANWLTGGFPGQ